MELIDREKLKATIRNMVELPNEVRAQVLGAISRAKAVDAKLVVHGRWERKENGSFVCGCCSQVKVAPDMLTFLLSTGKWNRCPNCGAQMDGGAEDGK